jgi:site-specific DNA-methyltransferase (adenine-specific)
LITPYWRDESRGLTIYHGDCREILPTFADGEFGSVIGDPGYGVGVKDYDDTPPDSEILRECLRVSTGTVLFFGGAPPRSLRRFLMLQPPPERVVIWDRVTSHVPPCGSTMSWRWHPIFLWRYDKQQRIILMDILRWCKWPTRHALTHPAMKPLSTMGQLVRAFGGRSILDPYMGSGTTLVAAAQLGIPATGIEIEARYVKLAVARLEGTFLEDESRHLFNQHPTDGP